MKKVDLIRMIAACGNPIRMDVLSLLIRAKPKGIIAGKLSKRLKLGHTNLSFHLKPLVESGLITVKRNGQTMVYSANPIAVARMLRYMSGTFLSDDYCAVIRKPESGTINFEISYDGQPLKK